MSDIHIERVHNLGLVEARAVAREWAGKAAERFDMECTYVEDAPQATAPAAEIAGFTLGSDSVAADAQGACDCLSFSRSGVSGTLRVDASTFTLDAELGFLLGAFKERIEQEISRNLDSLLADRGVTSPSS